MKTISVATLLLVLGALAGALAVGCAEPPRPASSAQNPTGDQASAAASPGAASAKDGGGGW